MFNKLKLTSRLLTGFGVIIAIFGILMFFNMNRMWSLSEFTGKMYRHPFTVTNAVQRVNTNIIKIHRAMQDVLFAVDIEEITKDENIIDVLEVEVYRDFEIIAERFLGEKKLHEYPLQQFKDWKPIRDEVIALMSAGQRQDAFEISRNNCIGHVEELEASIAVLIDFAGNKASSLLKSSEDTRDSSSELMYLLIVAAIIFAVIFALYLTRSIVMPITILRNAAIEVGKGDLDTEIWVRGEGELSELAGEFDEMRLKLRDSYSGLEENVKEKTRELSSTLTEVRDRNIQLRETRDAMLNLVQDLEIEVAEHKRAEDKVKSQLEHLGALRSIDIAIASSLDLNVTLDVFLDQVITQLNADAADVLLLNQHTLTLDHASSKGFRTNYINDSSMEMGEGYAGFIALERERVYELDISNISDKCKRLFLIKDEEFKTYFGIPLIVKGTVKGVLEIFHRSSYTPDVEWYNFLETLADQAAIAIDNSVMFDEVQNSRDELLMGYETTIEGWARALDYRDKETEGHSRRVTNITVTIAGEMGIEATELVHIRRGALLHDIGKLGIPDKILFKPGPLTEQEWELMRRHPLIAYEILSPIPFLRQALDIPYCHHEKMDGTGYPRGLKGDAIPLSARIFAIVDVWDALISDRPYRAAWSEEKAIEHIRSLSGTHFDSEIVKVFLKMQMQ